VVPGQRSHQTPRHMFSGGVVSPRAGGLGSVAPPLGPLTHGESEDTEVHTEVDFEENRSWWPATHAVLRWPLFLIGCFIIGAALVLYLATRALVVLLEWLWAPPVVHKTKKRMAEAQSYEDWLAAAEALDLATGRVAWKTQQQSQLYAYKLVASATAELCHSLEQQDYKRLLQCLQQVLRDANFARHLNEDLYSQSFAGTKFQIDEFCAAVCHSLHSVRDQVERLGATCLKKQGSIVKAGDDHTFNLVAEARVFSEFAVGTFGRSALCLSGGGAMALQHFGLVAELFQRGLLPQVISGTSGGAGVAGYFCCRTDEELRGEVTAGKYPLKLEPEHIRSMVTWPFEGTWIERLKHYWQHGSLFSKEVWDEMARACTLGDTTFLEAYRRTGRVLNISASVKGAEGGQQTPVLLNYQTHPHVLIRSALLCSSAVPGMVMPMQLLEKCPETGEIHLHSEELFYVDGSIDHDIPLHSLAQTFGVRYTVVSQVNPHVTPFLFSSRGQAGSPISWHLHMTRWRGGFLLNTIECLSKETIQGMLKIMAQLELLPMTFGTKWDLLFTQDFEGSITLSSNRNYFWKVRHALSNPSESDMRCWWDAGRQVLWPKLALIEKRLRPEVELFRLEAAVDKLVGTAEHANSSSNVDASQGGRRQHILNPRLSVSRKSSSLFGA